MTVLATSQVLLVIALFLAVRFASDWETEGISLTSFGIGKFVLELGSVVFILYAAIRIREIFPH